MSDSSMTWFGMTREALAEHLRRLADDIETLNVGRTNSGAVVAINSWSLAARPVPCLIGRPVGHPTIADSKSARTSELFYFDPSRGSLAPFPVGTGWVQPIGPATGSDGEGQAMKAWIFSDLHTEFDEKVAPLKVPEADVCICAGDICDGGPAHTVRYLGEQVSRSMPVILVPGNHEYYRGSIVEGLREALDTAADRYPNVHVLSRRVVTLGGYRFVGATLWGDFNLYGNMSWALYSAQNELNDYRKIKVSKAPFRRFTAGHASGFNQMDKHFIRCTLDEPFVGPTVVVTHHAPSVLSLAPEFVGAPLTPSFVSNLEPDIAKYQPVAWVHGHLHNRSDYTIIDTRVICNPRGYPDEPVPDFDPRLVIDLRDHAVG